MTWEIFISYAGLTSAGEVGVELVGTNVNANIQVNERSKANFEHTFDAKSRVLALTNTSEIGIIYIWTIGGEEQEPQTTKETIKKDLSNYQENAIRVSLTVESDCGSSTYSEVIELPGDRDKTCQEEVEILLVE